jgi:hypothetical protein
LDGDPQHAGFQFRASNEVFESTAKQTFYIRPNDGKDAPGKTKNWPQNKDMTNLNWKAQSLVVGGQRYFTLYLDHETIQNQVFTVKEITVGLAHISKARLPRTVPYW